MTASIHSYPITIAALSLSLWIPSVTHAQVVVDVVPGRSTGAIVVDGIPVTPPQPAAMPAQMPAGGSSTRNTPIKNTPAYIIPVQTNREAIVPASVSAPAVVLPSNSVVVEVVPSVPARDRLWEVSPPTTGIRVEPRLQPSVVSPAIVQPQTLPPPRLVPLIPVPQPLAPDSTPLPPLSIAPVSVTTAANRSPVAPSAGEIVVDPILVTESEVADVREVPVSLQAQATQGNSVCPAQLPTLLNRVVNRTSGIRWSIQVQTQGSGRDRTTLYNWNPRTPLAPASVNKLLTTAAVLHRLGPQFRLRTVVTGNTSGAEVATLRIIGRGDPSLQTSHMGVLAQRLNRLGLRRVNLLIGDDTYWRGDAINPNWDPDDTLAGYGAPVNSLMLNQNGIGVTLFPQQVGQALRVQWDDPTDAQDYRLSNRSRTVSTSGSESIDVYRDRNARIVNIVGQLRVGSASEPAAAAISNPGNYLLQKFRNALTANQITVNQSTLVRSTPAPPGELELAAIDSPPLSTLVVEANRESNNTYAEALLKTVGKAHNPNNTEATQAGIAGVKATLAPLGVDAGQYSMVDGSGLADNNRASSEALVQTLQAMANSSNAAVYRNSLAVAGENGTLKSRFRNTPAQGRVQAKTGTISGVVALAGYATPPNYSPVVFSLLANSGSASSATMRSAIDEMVLILMRLRRC